MNRRNFLRGLLAVPAAATLGRVYSFPTDIVIVDWRNILKMQMSASGWKSTEDIIRPLSYASYLKYSCIHVGPAINPVVLKQVSELMRRLASTTSHQINTSGTGISSDIATDLSTILIT